MIAPPLVKPYYMNQMMTMTLTDDELHEYFAEQCAQVLELMQKKRHDIIGYGLLLKAVLEGVW
jgi:hypothetical protein